MQLPIPKINAEFVRKYPYVFIYIIVLAIAGFFVSSYVSSNDKSAIQYQNQIDYLRAKIDKQDSVITGLYQMIAIRDGVIERIPDKVGEKVDSIYSSKKSKK